MVKTNIPLDEAMAIAGSGLYTAAVTFMCGVIDFAAFSGLQLSSVVIPAASCDLGLTTYQKGALGSMAYCGMLFSSHLWGFLSDTYGRRSVMLTAAIGVILVSLLTSLSPTASFLMVGILFIGVMVSGLYAPIYVFINESVDQSSRAWTMLVVCGIGPLASLYLPGMAWAILPLDISIPMSFLGIQFTSWRLFIALLAAPFFFATMFLYILPETPKFLLDKGRHEETMRVLRRMFTINQKNKETDFPVDSVVLDKGDVMEGVSSDGSKNLAVFCKTIFSQTAKIFSPPLLKYTLLSCALCICHLGTVNQFILWFPEVVNRLINFAPVLSSESVTVCDVMSSKLVAINNGTSDDSCDIKDSFFVVTMSSGGLQVLASFLFAYIAGKVEDKKKLMMVIGGLAMLASAVLIFANRVISIIVAMIIVIIALNVIFSVYVAMIVEFFPTALRTNALSIVLFAGRVASVGFTQFVGFLFEFNCQSVYPFTTFLLLCMCIMIFTLPMTRKV